MGCAKGGMERGHGAGGEERRETRAGGRVTGVKQQREQVAESERA